MIVPSLCFQASFGASHGFQADESRISRGLVCLANEKGSVKVKAFARVRKRSTWFDIRIDLEENQGDQARGHPFAPLIGSWIPS